MRASTFTLRVPAAWAGRVNSEHVRGMLGRYFGHPRALCADPGPGGAYLRLSLPGRPVRHLAGIVGQNASVALRRLIATNLALPAGRPQARIPLPQVALRPVPRVEILRRPGLPVPAYCPQCGEWAEHAYFGSRWLCTVCEGANRAVGRGPEVEWYEAFSDPLDGLRGWWRKWGLLIIVGALILLVVLRGLGGKPKGAVLKPKVIPVSEGFVVWVPAKR